MGYRDTESPNPYDLFLSANEQQPVTWQNAQIRHRMQSEQGRSLYRLDQLDAAYDDLDEDPMIRLEFDSFLPRIQRPAI